MTIFTIGRRAAPQAGEGLTVNIRTFQPGDEAAQAAIYNEAAASLSKFKPASADEIQRRTQAADFDPATRCYAEVDGKVVGYATFQPNGRVSYPWCLPGQEAAAEPLFQKVLDTMRARGLKAAFAAYRADWPSVREFFLAHGFAQAREMVNFVLDQVDLPTRPGSRRNPLTPLRQEDLPVLATMGRRVLRTTDLEALEQHFFHNAYFSADALFTIRSRLDDKPIAIGLLIANPDYAEPHQVDAAMPCFRLGAFGTEGLTTKRINGLFSFLTRDERDTVALALDLLGHAAFQFEDTVAGTLAAQVPSDVSHLLRVYQRYFRRQGSFPIYEQTL